MSIESAPTAAVSPWADLVSALICFAFGATVAVASWRMDRLENLHINAYEVPGLVPGLLGAMLMLLGLLLAFRALRRGALRGPSRGRADGADGREGGEGGEGGTDQPAATSPPVASRGYMAAVLGAMLFYSLVLVGHGLPFWLSTALFVSGFIFIFDRARQSAMGRSTLRQAVLALACGLVTSAVVSLAFEHIFYVRLP